MAKVKIQGHASGTGILTVTAPNTSTDRTITLPDATGTLLATEGAVTINDTGADVDFRVEGSGEANALFVQGSDGAVGIGTSSPSNKLDIKGTVGFEATNSTNQWLAYTYTDNTLRLNYNGAGADEVVIDSSGNVGIGTDSPASLLSVQGDGLQIRLDGTANTSRGILLRSTGTAEGQIHTDGNMHFIQEDASKYMRFSTANTERMRIDSSGHLHLGTTESVFGGADRYGHQLFANGQYNQSVDGDSATSAVYLNRENADGEYITFYKDRAEVGSIGVGGSSAQPTIGSGNTGSGGTAAGLRFDRANDAIEPWNVVTNAVADDIIDLGLSSIRFDDIYATNDTIQTSDRNEKQDIAELTDAEQRVAVAAKGLLRKFRWKSAVAEKGDEARTHFGIIAQDLQAAFAAEGLDAGDYAMFISSTWWETQTEVPVVEAVAEVTDEDGNVTTEAVEAKDAYTRTETFHTLEEAPEGATERTRLGVRYSELLAFIISAL